MEIREILKRHKLWAGFAAVLAPLAVLLAVQYGWLVKLDHTSALARQAELDNYLEAVTDRVEYSYRKNAERVLNLSPWMFTQDDLGNAAHHFKRKGAEGAGAKRLFVAKFSSDHKWKVLYFEPSCESFAPPEEWSPELRAVYVAVAPWATLAAKGGSIERALLTVEERDPHFRIILNPITDDAWQLVGVAGMVLDPGHFQDEILPDAIKKSLPGFLSDDSGDAPIVTVRDGNGRLVLATGPTDAPSFAVHREGFGKGKDRQAERAFSFVFTDWRISLDSRHATPAQVARRNFVLNLALSVALAAALLGGIVLTLRTASREMKLSQMKSDFVSNVSHELRTPLASIRVFGEFLRLGRVESSEKAREYGEYIETESRRLTQLINNILDFASIESGRKSYRFERASVEEVVAETLKTFEVRLRQSGFRIAYEGPAEPLPPVLFDPGAIAQSLSNLLDNAVKYSNGGREIQVRVRRAGGWIVIAVQDHGIGIPRDEQAKIFDRFHRVGTGLVHDVKGSGLGLSIVRHIIEAHRGRVTVESQVGKGSTFSILLPIDAVAARESAAPERAFGPDAAPREQPSEA